MEVTYVNVIYIL